MNNLGRGTVCIFLNLWQWLSSDLFGSKVEFKTQMNQFAFVSFQAYLLLLAKYGTGCPERLWDFGDIRTWTRQDPDQHDPTLKLYQTTSRGPLQTKRFCDFILCQFLCILVNGSPQTVANLCFCLCLPIWKVKCNSALGLPMTADKRDILITRQVAWSIGYF